MTWNYIGTYTPPEQETLIVTYVDDTGDTEYVDVTVAWKIGEYWISGDEVLIGKVTHWMRLPKPAWRR